MKHLYLPGKIYFKDGSTSVALRELTEVYKLKRAFLVTSAASYAGGAVSGVNAILEKLGMKTAEYFGVGDPVSESDIDGAGPKLGEFEPDVIIGLGNSSVMSAAKLIRRAAEKSGKKIMLVLIPTSFSDGSQNTPFAQLETDSGLTVISGFDLIPEMTITDSGFVKNCPAEQVRADASNLLKLVVKAYLAPEGSEFTDGFLKEAAKSILGSYADAVDGCKTAKDKLHNAGSIAGNAFGNVFDTFDPSVNCSIPKESDLSDDEKARFKELAAYLGYKNVKEVLKACSAIV